MLLVDSPDVYEASFRALKDHNDRVKEFTGRKIRGRMVQVFMGIRRHPDQFPEIGSRNVVDAGWIQQMLDQMYTKTTRDPPGNVLTDLFNGEGGYGKSKNRWRNNIGAQKGVGCDGDIEVFATVHSHPQGRLGCPHHRPGTDPDNPHKGAMCALTGNTYRSDLHKVWLRRMPGETGRSNVYQVADVRNVVLFKDCLAPGGSRLPIWPLIGVLYHGAVAGVYPARQQVGTSDFAADFGFDDHEMETYFDVNPDLRENARVIQASPSTFHGHPVELRPHVLPVENEQAPQFNVGWWDAQKRVAHDLQQAGWAVRDCSSHAGYGCDLEAEKNGTTIYVEVKSSVETCYPTLTEKEYERARKYKRRYLLAIVDNWKSTGALPIQYVPDPARPGAITERVVKQYATRRSEWDPVAVADLDSV